MKTNSSLRGYSMPSLYDDAVYDDDVYEDPASLWEALVAMLKAIWRGIFG